MINIFRGTEVFFSSLFQKFSMLQFGLDQLLFPTACLFHSGFVTNRKVVQSSPGKSPNSIRRALRHILSEVYLMLTTSRSLLVSVRVPRIMRPVLWLEINSYAVEKFERKEKKGLNQGTVGNPLHFGVLQFFGHLECGLSIGCLCPLSKIC